MQSSDIKKYTANDLAEIGVALYGTHWQTELAKNLNLSGSRRVRAWLTGERKIPPGVWSDIIILLKQKNIKITELIKKMENNKSEELK